MAVTRLRKAIFWKVPEAVREAVEGLECTKNKGVRIGLGVRVEPGSIVYAVRGPGIYINRPLSHS